MVFASVVFYIGLLTLLYHTYSLYKFYYIYFVHKSKIDRYNHGTEPWSLVTGATGEIGIEFAAQLCARGFNIILHGRNETKLSQVQENLRRAYPGRQICILVIDSTTATPPEISQSLAPFQSKNLTVLVNNAGGANDIRPTYKTLEEYSDKEIDGLINLNSRFPTHVTKELLPILAANEPALILNVSSMSEKALPYFPVYGGSKAYISTFTKALAAERASQIKQVDLQCVLFGAVNTFNARLKFSVAWNIPSAKTAVAAALDKVGCGQTVLAGYWGHEIEQMPLEFMPEVLRNAALIRYLGQLKDREARGWNEAISK